ncbi:MAG: hypothetical protein K2L50_00380 [Bacteroidales bacterium]|nr:hypothetical protein [Bacteroidales bacterium]
MTQQILLIMLILAVGLIGSAKKRKAVRQRKPAPFSGKTLSGTDVFVPAQTASPVPEYEYIVPESPLEEAEEACSGTVSQEWEKLSATSCQVYAQEATSAETDVPCGALAGQAKEAQDGEKEENEFLRDFSLRDAVINQTILERKYH